MSVVENFAALTAQEQRAFANALIKTINTENIFSSEVDFEITAIEADDMTGDLIITASHTNPVEVPRRATWQVDDADDADNIYLLREDSEIFYHESVIDDARKAFKTMEAVIEGYKVSLDITDMDEDEIVEADVSSMTDEDAGIGSYEFWGASGYDSDEYIEVEGTITEACTCILTFWVEPAEEPRPEYEEN